MKKKLLCILLIGAMVLATSGCTETGNQQATLKLIPSKSTFVGNIEVNAILNDGDFNTIYEAFPKSSSEPQTIAEVVQEIETESGVDVKTISDITFFGGASMDQYMGFFLIGSFQNDDIVNKVLKEGNYEQARYQGYEYYMESNTWGSSESFIEIDEGIILFANSVSVIEDVIDIQKGDTKGNSGNLMDTYTSMDDGIVKVVFEVPSSVKEDISTANSGPMSMESFSEIDMVTYLFQKKSSTLTNTVLIHTSDTASAEDIADVIDGLLKVYKGMIPDEQVKDSIEKIAITQQGSTVTIRSSSTVQEIVDMIGSLDQMSY